MVIDNFHRLYNNTFKIKNLFLNKVKFPAICRLIILQAANLLIPLVLSKQKNNKKFSLNSNNKNETDFVVSLTSFPNRIGKVHLVIESILRQTYSPKRIVLWLSKEQFDSIDTLPEMLLKLKDRGLEIRLTEGDLRSYKKYYFLLKESSECAFIIVDDDVFYKSTMLSELIDMHIQYPNSICANRCAIINVNAPYASWGHIWGASTTPRFDLLPTGCGGVLYPSNSLHKDSLNSDLFTSVCKDADDIWLSICAYMNDTPTVYTGHNEYLLAVNSFNNLHLHTKNVGQSLNDKRIESVRNYYKKENGIDVFNRT
jgi:hypothetical protein